MSKLLATKESTPLSENVQIGPKCQYFVWPPLFYSTALTLLGMEFTRASQVATGVLFHSSMTTSQSWWMLETFLLGMPHGCSIGFRSGDILGQSITFTLSFFSKALVILEVCLGSLSCWNTALRPSLCFSMSQYMSQYMLAFMVPPMNCSSSVPAALMQPQTMTLPPPCLTVGKTDLSLYSSPGCRHTRLTPSEPNKFILVSSDNRAWFQ